ncbi:alpha-galactosidase [Salpingoeca rosetta]|uniref:Alpha-galactosidase n=1 Tax=Salpingoeca rosetta (strain ATCC 50818 / BSB-021) TaxID=946362 RepID=F2U1G2_SALR5|nr:alpha-galactosidase [Salpingoeca rosetta]EGD81464.1 alpha-galactosidase [Salpingoeca rosetta]|eukprot:XP_004996668.1 alpha-galactosidase [Salpingoeca rosetta]
MMRMMMMRAQPPVVLLAVVGVLACLPATSLAYDNGVALKPAMGWNTWCTLSDCHNGDNKYFDRCNEWEIRDIAEAMLTNGMYDLGYRYINLDDCWAATERDAQGNIQPDPDRFPSGMRAMADWLHKKGLKFGLYTSMGSATCNRGGRPKDIPGSFGHYKEDAATFASWHMDYVKVDWCGHDLFDSKLQHTELSNALNATGRPIWLELCRGYSYDPIPPYVAEVAQSWRATGDHQDEWSNSKTVIQAFMNPSNPSVPHAWNYGDFLMTGGPGCNVNASLHCPRQTDDEYRTTFSVWSIASSPLIVATDIRNMTAIMTECLLNKEAIAINQDYTSAAGKLIGSDTRDPVCASGGDGDAPTCPVFGRKLSDGTYAAVLINLADSGRANVTMDLGWLGLPSSATVTVNNILKQRSMGTAKGTLTVPLSPHESVYVRLTRTTTTRNDTSSADGVVTARVHTSGEQQGPVTMVLDRNN